VLHRRFNGGSAGGGGAGGPHNSSGEVNAGGAATYGGGGGGVGGGTGNLHIQSGNHGFGGGQHAHDGFGGGGGFGSGAGGGNIPSRDGSAGFEAATSSSCRAQPSRSPAARSARDRWLQVSGRWRFGHLPAGRRERHVWRGPDRRSDHHGQR